MKKKAKMTVKSRAGKKEERTAWLCLIPAFLGVTLISYLPTLAVFVLSLFEWNGLTTPEFVGLANFRRIFTKDIYLMSSLRATIGYAFLAVVGAIVYSLIIALLLNMDIKGRTLFRSIFFIPYLLPAIGVFKGWQWLYEGNFGLFNFILRMLGLPPQRFLDSPSQVILCLVMIAVWTSGNLIVIFLAGLQNVPRVYQEAAKIDGANAWQRFWNITIPSISPIIFYNVLTALITHLQVINPALALTDGGPAKRSMFMSYVIYMYGFRKNKLGYAAAYSVVFFILVGIFTIILFKTQKENIFGEGE
ncbi:carbohydrate ABC transporter permease [Jingyaoa shaoxingensis]|uniref:Sugar ABC transporter permease n=1 Tax=Jingyaoa shaoxingensis TaxID=2763671 RepID=A0ABR7N6Y4_9FIRM|nr:sugar ABC transporter permease [Jingyaoa shaoxingensis]MBC8572152.1 sugar ABC transporter permease [Jingyaoa shaoxingensis]